MGNESSKYVAFALPRRASAVRRLSRVAHPFSHIHTNQAISATMEKLKRHKSSTTVRTDAPVQPLGRSLSIVKPRVRNVENFVIVWLDLKINIPNKEYYSAMIELGKIVNTIHKFTDIDQCISYLYTIEDDKILMIVSDRLGQQIVPCIHEMVQLESIYVFCGDTSSQERWTKEFTKIKGIFTEIESLCNILDRKIQQLESLMLPISILFSSSTIDLNEIDPIFIWSQLFKIILSEIDFNSKTKEDFTDFCRIQYAESHQILRIIDQFEQDYDPKSPIWWYTEDCFIFSMLNRALRVQDIEIITKMAFFIRDLNYQIEKLNSESNNRHPYTVYRGQSMPMNRFEELNNSQNGLFSFNNFVSAIADRHISFESACYDRDNPDLIGVLFQIDIDPSIPSAIFATLDKDNHLSEEIKKILFSMHTVFRIGKITQIKNCLYEVNLTLVHDNDSQLVRIIEYIKEATGEWNGWHRLSKLLIDVGNFDKAEELYLALLRMIPGENRKERAFIQYQLGYINEEKDNLSRALSRYEQCLDIQLTYLSANDPKLSSINSNIGAIFYKQGEFEKALEYFKFSLDVDLHASHHNQLNIATHYSNIGMALFALDNYTEALDNFEKTLELHLKYLSSNYQSLIDIHHNLAMTYDVLKRSKESVEHAERAVDIARQAFEHNHSVVQKQQEYLDTLV